MALPCINVQCTQEATNGQNGPRGRDGADAENGTNGGSSGQLIVEAPDNEQFILRVAQVAGKAGRGGKGELGLPGGLGGNPGKKKDAQCTVVPERGRDGVSGQPGRDGTDGKPGASPQIQLPDSFDRTRVLEVTP